MAASRPADGLVRAIQEARADGTGVIFTVAGEEDLPRMLAHLVRGMAPAPRTPGERVRLMARMVARAGR